MIENSTKFEFLCWKLIEWPSKAYTGLITFMFGQFSLFSRVKYGNLPKNKAFDNNLG